MIRVCFDRHSGVIQSLDSLPLWLNALVDHWGWLHLLRCARSSYVSVTERYCDLMVSFWHCLYLSTLSLVVSWPKGILGRSSQSGFKRWWVLEFFKWLKSPIKASRSVCFHCWLLAAGGPWSHQSSVVMQVPGFLEFNVFLSSKPGCGPYLSCRHAFLWTSESSLVWASFEDVQAVANNCLVLRWCMWMRMIEQLGSQEVFDQHR